MCVMTDVKRIGPTTYMAFMAIRVRWWHCNGTMTYRRRIRAICGGLWHQRMQSWRTPWLRSGPWRYATRKPNLAPPGSYEFARRAHIEMERIALRRPKLDRPA